MFFRVDWVGIVKREKHDRGERTVKVKSAEKVGFVPFKFPLKIRPIRTRSKRMSHHRLRGDSFFFDERLFSSKDNEQEWNHKNNLRLVALLWWPTT